MNQEEMISYAHPGDPKLRFAQLKKDKIPAWAVDIRPYVIIDITPITKAYFVAEFSPVDHFADNRKHPEIRNNDLVELKQEVDAYLEANPGYKANYYDVVVTATPIQMEQ